MSGAALIGWIAGVHLLGLGCVAFLLWPALQDNTGHDHRSDGEDEGWGRGPKTPPSPPEPPRGGLPLPDAQPAGVRLREHGKLGERLPRRERRPVREPDRRPAPTPHRSTKSGLGRTRR
ncbi:MAG TPA: hypothetical protein VE127_02475 [Solirubrobacteraceae bacterium]|nr:hypothetical protein [Solirubrobacteraceae bacterium]